MKTKDKLISIVTQWDKKQSTKRGYNPYALGIYMQAADSVCEEIERGAPIESALNKYFNDRLLHFLLENYK